MQGNIKLLDCTLRDGGQGLEDLNKNGIKTEIFTLEDREHIVGDLVDSRIDIIELGCMAESVGNKTGFAIYQNIEELSANIPVKRNKEQMYVGLYIGPDTKLEKIPEHSDELCDGIRVILRYSELEKSLKYCAALAEKGYKVFVQPMLTMRYTNDELKRLIYESNKMGAYAVYFVDSYGYMTEHDIDRIYELYDKYLDPEIHIGFHAHNNLDMAFSNARYFMGMLQKRNLIVDSCATGMGQGAGNLQTELIAHYMNKNFNKKYLLESILNICDTLEKFRKNEIKMWGYSPIRFVSAINEAAYKYAVAMKIQYNMPLAEIAHILSAIPYELKQRYTEENLKKVLDGHI